MRFDYSTNPTGTVVSTKLGALIYDSDGAILGDTATPASVPPDLAAGIGEGRYYVGADDGLPGNGPQPADWLASLTSVIPKAARFVAAEDFATVNLNRMKRGLPAIDVPGYGPQCAPPTLKGTPKVAIRRQTMKFQLGALVQNPETGEWYDDGTGSNVLTVPPGTPTEAGGLPATAAQPSDWISSLTKALPGVSAFLTAEQLAQVNISRAKAGQPPLQTSQYAPQVGVGLDSQTRNFLVIGGVALAGLVFLMKRRKSAA